MKIGIFDSGLGGLFVTKGLVKNLPQYDYVYLGDTQRVPYGNRSHETVYRFLEEAVDYLFKHESLVVGGIFAGQLLGNRDEWNNSSRNMTFHKKEEVERLFSSMEVIELSEEEKDEPTAIQPTAKHWHIFHIIAKKN